jgi:hypothetical protein
MNEMRDIEITTFDLIKKMTVKGVPYEYELVKVLKIMNPYGKFN